MKKRIISLRGKGDLRIDLDAAFVCSIESRRTKDGTCMISICTDKRTHSFGPFSAHKARAFYADLHEAWTGEDGLYEVDHPSLYGHELVHTRNQVIVAWFVSKEIRDAVKVRLRPEATETEDADARKTLGDLHGLPWSYETKHPYRILNPDGSIVARTNGATQAQMIVAEAYDAQQEESREEEARDGPVEALEGEWQAE